MTLVKEEDESIADIISSCLAHDPLERPSFEDILIFFALYSHRAIDILENILENMHTLGLKEV